MPIRTTHILLVEDDADLRGLLRRNLQARGHEVRLLTDIDIHLVASSAE